MTEHIFRVNLSTNEVLAIYQGAIKKIMVVSEAGLRIELNAKHFQKFTTNSGISGRFKITLDDANHIVKMEKIG